MVMSAHPTRNKQTSVSEKSSKCLVAHLQPTLLVALRWSDLHLLHRGMYVTHFVG